MKLLPLSLAFPHLAAASSGDSLFPGFHSLWSGTMMANTFLNHNPLRTSPPAVHCSGPLPRPSVHSRPLYRNALALGAAPLGSAVPMVLVPVAHGVLPVSLMVLNRKSVLNLKNTMT